MRNIILPLVSFVLFLSSCAVEPSNNSFSLIEEDEKKISALLSKMSVEEKVGQTCQITLDAILQKDESNKLIEPHQIDLEKLDEAINKYKVGSILNVSNHTFTLEKWNRIVKTIQDVASKSSTGIPMLHIFKKALFFLKK